jgi:uncharacterized protein YcbX
MAQSVKEIWRYPVKSMRGERISETQLGKGGIPFDRGWAVRTSGSAGRGASRSPGCFRAVPHGHARGPCRWRRSLSDGRREHGRHEGECGAVGWRGAW